MIDKYVMPVPIDMLKIENVIHSKKEINLTHFYEVLPSTKKSFEPNYIYYPYLITMYDFSIIGAIEGIHSNDSFKNLELLKMRMINKIKGIYIAIIEEQKVKKHQ